MGKKYRFYYIPLSVVIVIILTGAAIYFYNVNRQNKLSQKNLTEERLLNEINTCHSSYLIASKEKRAYQFYKTPYFLTNYETAKKKVQVQLNLLNKLLKKDTVYATFTTYQQLLNDRFVQMDQHLRLIQTRPLTEALVKINSDNGSAIESSHQTEVSFQQLMQAVESRSMALQKSIAQIQRSNYYGFIFLIVSTIVLILLNAIQAKKLTFENNRRENEKKLYDAVKISEQEFSSAFEYASIGIALIGINGEWLRVNNSLCNMLGYSNQEFLQTTFQDITHPDDLEIDLAYLQQLINNEISTYQMEKRYFTKKCEIIWINLSVSKVLNSDGSIRYFISQIENIHERKTAALILKTEKERFENVIEGTNAGTWEWNVQTGETVFNKRWAAIVGYTLAELEPININTWVNLANPDDLAESEKKLNECFEKKAAYYECECRMKHKDGHWVWVLDRGKVISWTTDGKPLMMFGTHTDITHQKETEVLLVESENKFRGIFNSTFQFIGFLSTDGTLLEANNTALDFAGLQFQDVIGKKFWDCYWWQISADTQEQLKICIQQAAAGEFIQYEVDIWDKHKKPQTIVFNLKPLLNEDGEVIAIIPEGRLIQDMVDARKKILEKNTELQQFASNASHDLKEPVRMIKSFMEKLQKKYEDKLDDTARQYIYFATDGATRMNNYITDLLEYAKTGTHEVTKQPVDINSVIKDILALQASSIQKKEAQINYDKLPVVTGYPTPIKMLFLNLITNALKFQSLQKKPVIHISANETEKYWEFTVSDNGIGIETENLENIFEMFRRLHDKTQFEGTGIGLATCKKVVELHGGSIWVTSEPGKGSCFFVKLLK